MSKVWIPLAALALLSTVARADKPTPDEVITGTEPANLCIPLDDDTMLACGDGKCDERDTVPAACPADCPDKGPAATEIKPYNFLTLCQKVQTVHTPGTIDEVKRIVTDAAKANRSLRVVSARVDQWVSSRYAHSANDQLQLYQDVQENLQFDTQRHFANLGFKSGAAAPAWPEARLPCTSALFTRP